MPSTWAWSGPSGSPARVRASQRWNAALVSSRLAGRRGDHRRAQVRDRWILRLVALAPIKGSVGELQATVDDVLEQGKRAGSTAKRGRGVRRGS